MNFHHLIELAADIVNHNLHHGHEFEQRQAELAFACAERQGQLAGAADADAERAHKHSGAHANVATNHSTHKFVDIIEQCGVPATFDHLPLPELTMSRPLAVAEILLFPSEIHEADEGVTMARTLYNRGYEAAHDAHARDIPVTNATQSAYRPADSDPVDHATGAPGAPNDARALEDIVANTWDASRAFTLDPRLAHGMEPSPSAIADVCFPDDQTPAPTPERLPQGNQVHNVPPVLELPEPGAYGTAWHLTLDDALPPVEPASDIDGANAHPTGHSPLEFTPGTTRETAPGPAAASTTQAPSPWGAPAHYEPRTDLQGSAAATAPASTWQDAQGVSASTGHSAPFDTPATAQVLPSVSWQTELASSPAWGTWGTASGAQGQQVPISDPWHAMYPPTQAPEQPLWGATPPPAASGLDAGGHVSEDHHADVIAAFAGVATHTDGIFGAHDQPHAALVTRDDTVVTSSFGDPVTTGEANDDGGGRGLGHISTGAWDSPDGHLTGSDAVAMASASGSSYSSGSTDMSSSGGVSGDSGSSDSSSLSSSSGGI